MALDMFHHNEISRAVRLICQSAVALTADTDGSDTVNVGSNQLFEVGQVVELLDEDSAAEEHTVAEKLGLTQLGFESLVVGEYTVAKGAIVRIVPPRLASLRWVGQGRPEGIPEPRARQLPCIVVETGRLEQPITEGTNKSFRQDYHYRVHYIRHSGQGEQDEFQALEEAGKLFNLLMQDTYLGGTCWHSQVTRVETRPEEERDLRARGLEVRVIALDLVARRAEVWDP